MRIQAPPERPAAPVAVPAERGHRAAEQERDAHAVGGQARQPGGGAAPAHARVHTSVPPGAGGAPDPTGVCGRRLDAFA